MIRFFFASFRFSLGSLRSCSPPCSDNLSFKKLPMVLPVLLASTLVQGQEDGYSGCRGIEEPLDRLACYDRLDTGSAQRPAARDPGPAPSASLPSPGQGAVEDFGRPAPRVEEGGQGRQELVDTVAAIRRITPRRHEVTLASGQVWRQVEDEFYNLSEGAQVRISPTGWGVNFRLSQEGLSGHILVQRIR